MFSYFLHCRFMSQLSPILLVSILYPIEKVIRFEIYRLLSIKICMGFFSFQKNATEHFFPRTVILTSGNGYKTAFYHLKLPRISP